MEGNGNFGKWITDDYGCPAYDYICDQFTNPDAKTPTTYGFSIDHFHQLGNDRITATAHNGGYVQVLESSRGFQWLTYYDEKKSKYGGGIALISSDGSEEVWDDLYDSNINKSKVKFKRIFGMGYYQKIVQRNYLKLVHTICTPFSDDPVLLSEIELFNESETETINNIKLIDFWDIYLHHILRSLIVTANNRKKFGKTRLLNGVGKLIKFLFKIAKWDTDGSRNKFDKKFKFHSIINLEKQAIIISPSYKKTPPVKFDEPAKHNYFPKKIFLSMLHGEAICGLVEQNEIIKDDKFKINFEKTPFQKDALTRIKVRNPVLGIGTKISLKPKESKRIICLFGYSDYENIEELIEKYKEITSNDSILNFNAENWDNSLIELDYEKEPWLSQETKWHSYYTRSTGYYDEYFKKHKFPQGSIYQFGHGLDGAIRDYVLYLKSIIFINPKLAKEYITFILSLMSPSGALPYSLYGFAKTFTGSVHSNPSDLYLFLIWGIQQYVYTTRDFNFLHEKIDFYPKSTGKSSTVLEKLYYAIKYLFSDKVGIGEHGLIKVNDGDWSDGISLMVKKRKKFIKYGESNFNSTFALYIIPKLVPLLKYHNPELAELCVKNLEILKESVLNSWNGKWYYRGWDGQGNPIGDKNIYLEHHTWLLISEILEKEEALKLIKEIYTRLDKRSPIGQYISFPAQDVKLRILPKGWDVNGGIWHAMNALLTWAYSKYDHEKALNSLKKNSMAQRAESYPNIWYGIWSGPDAYISDYAENAGEAFYHLTTPMCDFPLMNLNIHACYLLSVIKMVGFEASHDSIEINPNLIQGNFKFTSQILSVESTDNVLLIEFKSLFNKQFKFKIVKPSWWKNESKIVVNGIEIKENKERVSITENIIIINTNKSQKKLRILLS